MASDGRYGKYMGQYTRRTRVSCSGLVTPSSSSSSDSTSISGSQGGSQQSQSSQSSKASLNTTTTRNSIQVEEETKIEETRDEYAYIYYEKPHLHQKKCLTIRVPPEVPELNKIMDCSEYISIGNPTLIPQVYLFCFLLS